VARIRSIKPEFWSSEQVMECSPTSRLLFIGLWNFCDDGGNHVDSAKTIKAEIFPGDDISSTDVRRMLDELSSNGLIVYYTHENKTFLHVTGWHHQKIDRPTMKHPPFRGAVSEGARRALDESSPPEGRGGEGSGEEWKGGEPSSAPLALTADPPADLQTRRAGRIQQIAEEAREAYNRILAKPNGLLPACTVLNKPRLKAVEKALPTARLICAQLYGNERITPRFWEDYFTEASLDDFHAGRKKGGPGHEGWKPDLEFLLREEVMAKLFDRASSEDAA
jgi:hypothetical protein